MTNKTWAWVQCGALLQASGIHSSLGSVLAPCPSQQRWARSPQVQRRREDLTRCRSSKKFYLAWRKTTGDNIQICFKKSRKQTGPTNKVGILGVFLSTERNPSMNPKQILSILRSSKFYCVTQSQVSYLGFDFYCIYRSTKKSLKRPNSTAEHATNYKTVKTSLFYTYEACAQQKKNTGSCRSTQDQTWECDWRTASAQHSNVFFSIHGSTRLQSGQYKGKLVLCLSESLL